MFGSEINDAIYNIIRYLESLKSSDIYFSYYFVKIKVDYYDSLPNDKRITLHNVLIHIILVLHKDKNHYYYKIFLEKWFYQLAKNNQYNFFHSIDIWKEK